MSLEVWLEQFVLSCSRVIAHPCISGDGLFLYKRDNVLVFLCCFSHVFCVPQLLLVRVDFM